MSDYTLDINNLNVSQGKKVDLLTEDKPIPGQKFCCISFLSPENVKGCTIRGLKIRGSFDTHEEASNYAKFLRDSDPDFDVLVGEVGKWLPWDPEPNSIKDQVYYEEELNKLMAGYKENQDKGRIEEGKRRKAMLEESIKQTQAKPDKKTATLDRLRKKLDEKKSQEAHKNQFGGGKISNVDEGKVSKPTDESPANAESELKAIDDNLEKMKSLYNDMLKKKN
jgi:hypothetical protein